MYTTVLIIFFCILLLLFFKKKSRSDFFKQDEFALSVYRDYLEKLLKIKGRDINEINQYLKAYDFFCRYSTKFDGATIVKDLHDIPGLDADAMLHDYLYLTGANRSFSKKWKADLQYIQFMEKQGKGVRVTRLILLTVVLALYVPYCYCFTPLYKD